MGILQNLPSLRAKQGCRNVTVAFATRGASDPEASAATTEGHANNTISIVPLASDGSRLVGTLA